MKALTALLSRRIVKMEKTLICSLPGPHRAITALSLLSLVLVTSIGCTTHKLYLPTEGCKTRTYVNLQLVDYITRGNRFSSPPRLAVMPFDVPESFARSGNESTHYGRELARKFQLELRRSGELPIVELFNVDKWPGKREEYFTGNYGAISRATDAGFDLLFLGYVDEIDNED
ncbi:MAG: hypothetical protein KDD44_14965, partial [Bdellovibrionales bacterium]|nr:hypothetical protein [Bdellovibrionales bacterium]